MEGWQNTAELVLIVLLLTVQTAGNCDFIDSFSHANNKHTCNLCKSTLVDDDDSYDDRRKLLSFKAYDSDASYGGLFAPSNVMLQYKMQLEETFVKHLSNLQKLPVSVMISYNFSKAFNLISLVTLLTKNIF